MSKDGTPARKPKLVIVIFLVFLGLLVLSAGGFLLWALWIPQPGSISLAALENDDTVSVSDHGWLEFSPRHQISVGSASGHVDETSMTLPETAGEDSETLSDNEPQSNVDQVEEENSVALILYPGSRLDYRTYAPIAREVAREGHLVIVFPMPLNLAFLKADAAHEVMQAYPSIRHWVIGGHALGGATAAQFIRDRPAKENIVGLLLLAALSPVDLSGFSNLKVLSIHGDQDGILGSLAIAEGKRLLPPTTQFKTIAGANNSYFAATDQQMGDNPAKISPEAQRKTAAKLITDFLRSR